MIITIKDNVAQKKTPQKVDVRILYDHDNAQTVYITLQHGERLKPSKSTSASKVL